MGNSIQDILIIIQDHNLKAYSIAKNCELPALTIQNIIDGFTKNPREKTKKELLKGIEGVLKKKSVKYQLTPKLQDQLKESQSSYTIQDNFNSLPIDQKLNTIYEAVLQNKMKLDFLEKSLELLKIEAALENIPGQKKQENS